MGKGERRRRPPVPGGVIWWDQKGVQQHTPYPPGTPLRAAIMLFFFGGFVGFQCIMFFVMAVTLEQTGIVIGGVVCVVISALLIGGGCKCYHMRKKDVITVFYPTSGAVEYIMGCRTLYQPPPDYTPPPGFNPPQPGTVYQNVVVQPGVVAYNPAAPPMPPQGGQPYYPGVPAPQPGQQPYYNPSAPPPPGGTGQTYPGYGPPTGYATQYWNPAQPSNPPPQQTEKQDSSDPPPPAYNQVVNKV